MEKQFNENVLKNNENLKDKVKCVPYYKTDEETGTVEYTINYYSHLWIITKQKSSVGDVYYMLRGNITNSDGKTLRFSQRLSIGDEDILNYYKDGFLAKLMLNAGVAIRVQTRLMYGYEKGRIFGALIILLAGRVKKFIKIPAGQMEIIEDSIIKGKYFDLPLEKHIPREDDFTEEL